MQKTLVHKLVAKAKEVQERFSNPDRDKNTNGEIFTLDRIRPLSDYSAVVVYSKNTGKKSAFFFYYVESGDGYWNYFVPKDSHIVGMQEFGRFKQEIEEFNFDKN